MTTELVELADLLAQGCCMTSGEVEQRLRALASRAGGWRSIDSAPKDGTLYLCWVDAIRYGERDDGQLDQADVSDVDFGQWRDFESGGAHMNMMGDIGDGQQITHWMPLPGKPEPPAAPEPVAEGPALAPGCGDGVGS